MAKQELNKSDEVQSDENKEENKEENKKEDEKQKTQEELLAEKDAELEKAKAENDRLLADNVNYKQAITNKQIDNFTLEDEKEEKPDEIKEVKKVNEIDTEDEKTWDEVNKRAKQIAEQTYTGQNKKEILKNEKVAKRAFFGNNPEVLSNTAMQLGIKEYYVNRHGKSVEGIKIDLQDAYNLYKVNNNIPLTEEKKEDVNNLTNMPTGEGAIVDDAEVKLKESEKKQISDFIQLTGIELTEDQFLRYKQSVLNEERGAPQEVINLFNQPI